jgi:hypothetical protein
MEEDFLLDDDDLENQLIVQSEDEEAESDGEGESIEDLDSSLDDFDESSAKSYGSKMTSFESWLSLAYDDILKYGKAGVDGAIEAAATIVVKANPKHTSEKTIGDIVKDLFHKQGHSRMVNTVYTPEGPLRGEDVDLDFLGEDDSGFNQRFAREAREQIARFIGYLASRDLSKDSIISRRRKQRHIPAFIIFMFSSGMYDLIVECPTMPEEYASQIKYALETIMKSKYDIVEELAKKYEEMGRQKVADRVRKMQLAWFAKEPAEIRTAAELSDLDLTYDDVLIYREYRSKFTNTSKTITQDIISDLIEVVVDKDAGIYEKLKDKTRADAISDVKQVYKDWSRENPVDSDLANKIIWKDVDTLKK